jgi:predicted N-acetyltransferase YhbS
MTEKELQNNLNKNSVTYHQETSKDYYESEHMTQRAFWNKYFPGCDEHYLVHKLREHKDYIPELTLVAVHNEKIVGLVMYAHSKIINEKEEYPCITFGPLAVDPLYQNQGIGRELLKRSFDIARSMGFSRVVILGEPNYYPKLGFNTCDKIGVTTSDGENFPAFMYYELVPGAFSGVKGKFIYSECYHSLHGKEVEQFNKKFPPLEKKVLPGQWGHLQE